MEKATTEEIRLILKMMSKGYKVPKMIYDVVFDTAKRDIEEAGKVVIYKRDPNIHSSRAQGAYVKIIEGETLDVHPTASGGFGFDHDGDTMAIYAPMSDEAQQEVKDKMMSVTDKTRTNAPMFELSKDMLIGIFTLTAEHKDKSPLKSIKAVKEAEDFHIGQNISITIKGQKIKTTAGRVIFNDALPNWHPFVNEDVNKKALNKIMDDLLEKSQDDFADTIDKVMRLGFKYATLYPKTLDLKTLVIPPHIMKMKDELNQVKTVAEQSVIQDKIEKVMMEHFKKTHSDLYFVAASGGSKGMNQLRQMMVCKGLIQDPDGNILPPITKSINEGYSPQEYFDAAAGSRKGTTDRALNTGNGGYAYRKMIFCVGNVQADINNGNCGTKRTLDIKLTKELFGRMSGRFVHDETGIIKPISKDMVGQIIKLRSPIFCKSRKLCRTCYGNLLKQMNSENVGMIAAQEVASLSEKIMKGFHLGGAVILHRLDIIKEFMDNLNDHLEPKLRKSVKQEENDLINLLDLAIIRIDKRIYEHTPIKKEDDHYLLPVGHFNLMLGDVEVPVGIEVPVKIYIPAETEEDDIYISLMYAKDDKILYVEPTQENFSDLARYLDTLVGGKYPWQNVSTVYKKFFKALSSTGNWDSVHLEVIISNIMRAKSDPQKPARLVEPFDPVMYSIKTLPNIISWSLGISFENWSKGVQYGMISERGPESSIEKVLMGMPLSEKGK